MEERKGESRKIRIIWPWLNLGYCFSVRITVHENSKSRMTRICLVTYTKCHTILPFGYPLYEGQNKLSPYNYTSPSLTSSTSYSPNIWYKYKWLKAWVDKFFILTFLYQLEARMANRFKSAFKFWSTGSGFCNKKAPEVTFVLCKIKNHHQCYLVWLQGREEVRPEFTFSSLGSTAVYSV